VGAEHDLLVVAESDVDRVLHRPRSVLRTQYSILAEIALIFAVFALVILAAVWLSHRREPDFA